MSQPFSRSRLAVFVVLCLASLAMFTAHAAEQKITELRTIDKKVGDGAKAVSGARVTVEYTGWLYDADAKDHHGEQFDSSRDRDEPFSFILGTGQVIDGWDRGVKGMRVGGERTIIIPPDLAYGSRGAGASIPPNAPLIFDVTLEDVER